MRFLRISLTKSEQIYSINSELFRDKYLFLVRGAGLLHFEEKAET